jgi:rSAM/selenodomain-associated transferase 1
MKTGFPFTSSVQQGADLGERMVRAMENSFQKGFDRVVIIGGDCFEMTPAIIHEAFQRLHVCDCVIGPATDGGYYLIGLRRSIPDIFQSVPWGTSAVLNRTIQALHATPYSHCLLDRLSDVDTMEDVLDYEALRELVK